MSTCRAALASGVEVRAIGTGATLPTLGLRGRELVAWMARVERAEAVYARYHVDMSRDGATLWRILTARRRRHEARLAFDELLGAVRGLRVAWELFGLCASAQNLSSRGALQTVLPGLFEHAPGRHRELRTDTTLSYVTARSAADVAHVLRRRLDLGYC